MLSILCRKDSNKLPNDQNPIVHLKCFILYSSLSEIFYCTSETQAKVLYLVTEPSSTHTISNGHFPGCLVSKRRFTNVLSLKAKKSYKLGVLNTRIYVRHTAEA